jgi:hypothetical protein
MPLRFCCAFVALFFMALQWRICPLQGAKVRQTIKRFRKKRGFVSQNSGTVSRCNAEYGAVKGCKWCQNCQKITQNRRKWRKTGEKPAKKGETRYPGNRF